MAILDIQLDQANQLRQRQGAMVYMKGDIEVKTKTREGGIFFGKLKVSMLGGESFFVNNYIAKGGGCSIGLTGAPIGDIISVLEGSKEYG